MTKKNSFINASNITGIILIILLLPVMFGFLLTYHISFNSIFLFLFNIISYFIAHNGIYLILIGFIILSMFVKNKQALMVIKIITFLLMGMVLVYGLVYDITFVISALDSGLKILFLEAINMIAAIVLRICLMVYVINTIPNGQVSYICNTILFISLALFTLLISLTTINELSIYAIFRIVYLFLVLITRFVIALYFYFYK